LSNFKDDKKVVCGTGEGVLNIFNNGEWGNMVDRMTGHPSSVDAIVKLTDDVLLTGCFDGNIRLITNNYNKINDFLFFFLNRKSSSP
jgi:hypothetical protein